MLICIIREPANPSEAATAISFPLLSPKLIYDVVTKILFLPNVPRHLPRTGRVAVRWTSLFALILRAFFHYRLFGNWLAYKSTLHLLLGRSFRDAQCDYPPKDIGCSPECLSSCAWKCQSLGKKNDSSICLPWYLMNGDIESKRPAKSWIDPKGPRALSGTPGVCWGKPTRESLASRHHKLCREEMLLQQQLPQECHQTTKSEQDQGDAFILAFGYFMPSRTRQTPQNTLRRVESRASRPCAQNPYASLSGTSQHSGSLRSVGARKRRLETKRS